MQRRRGGGCPRPLPRYRVREKAWEGGTSAGQAPGLPRWDGGGGAAWRNGPALAGLPLLSSKGGGPCSVCLIPWPPCR